MRLKNLCVMFGVFVFVLVSPFAAMAGWVTETVDSEGDVGRYDTSIAVDSSGNVHISYHDYTNSALKYATNASGSWVIETVDGNGDVGLYSSIALDSSDNVYIIYSISDTLKYAGNASGSWVIETIESINDGTGGNDGGDFHDASIAIDSSDNLHISYTRRNDYDDDYDSYSSHDLKYATNASGSWVKEIIEDVCCEYQSIDRTSIAVDSSGNAHISYHASYSHYAYSDSINYATNASGSWIREGVAGVASLGSIAVDSGDNAYISYVGNLFYGATPELKYTTNASGSWVAGTVDSVGRSSRRSIALDSGDNIHISYNYGNNLKYATNSSGSWVTEIPDCEGSVGLYNSIAIDSSDNVHISYYDSTNGDLKYATNAVPEITASPESYDFGSIQKRKSSPPATFTISNTGTADLVIGGVYLTGANPYQFSIQNDNCSDQTIAPSGSCAIEAIFNPTKTGTFNALIGIDSNDPDTTTLNIELIGTGVMGHMRNEG